jgi:hypothetical protein
MRLIISRTGSPIATVNIGPDAKYTHVLMDREVVIFSVQSATVIPVLIGDTVTVFAQTFYMNTLPRVTKKATNLYEYEFVFEALRYNLGKVAYQLTGLSEFYLMGNASSFIDLIVTNMNRVYGAGSYTKGSVPSTEYRNLSFNNENCLAVLQTICSEYELEFYFSGTQINLSAKIGVATGLTFKYGMGKGLYEISRINVDSSNVITKLFVQGSDRNIPATYRNWSKRLMFANPGTNYLLSNVATYGTIEGSKTFEDVYPRRLGTIGSVGDIFTFYDTGCDFDVNSYLIPGVEAKISFKTGNLAGYEFNLASYTLATDKFIINPLTEQEGLILPNATLKPVAGDTYVILGISMPASYITAAETELSNLATAEIAKISSPKVKYSFIPDPLYVKKNAITFAIGNTYNIIDTDLGISTTVRTVSLTRKITSSNEYDIELADVVYKRWLTAVATQQSRHAKVLQTVATRGVVTSRDIGIAQTTADSKRINFNSTPVTPYSLGDTWTDGAAIKRCTTARGSGSYTAGDWFPASTYDNTATVIAAGDLKSENSLCKISFDPSTPSISVDGAGGVIAQLTAVQVGESLATSDYIANYGKIILNWRDVNGNIIDYGSYGPYSIQFKDSANVLLYGISGLGVNLPKQSSDPSPTAALLYYNSTANKIKYYNGTSWIICDQAITISGTPADNRLAVWTSATAIEGEANLTFSSNTLAIGNAQTTSVLSLHASGSAYAWQFTHDAIGKLVVNNFSNYPLTIRGTGIDVGGYQTIAPTLATYPGATITQKWVTSTASLGILLAGDEFYQGGANTSADGIGLAVLVNRASNRQLIILDSNLARNGTNAAVRIGIAGTSCSIGGVSSDGSTALTLNCGSNFVPSTSGNDLGTTSYRWTLYSDNVDVSTDGTLAATFKSTVNSATGQVVDIRSGASSETCIFIKCFYNTSTESGQLRVNAGTFSAYDSSDISIKTNIRKSGIDAIDILTNLNVWDFTKRETENVTGYIAQEADIIYPKMTCWDEDSRMFLISKDALIPVLHKGFQIHWDRTAVLEQRITELETLLKIRE